MKNKMKTRLLSLLLCCVMLFGLVPTTVLAAEKNKISEFEATATLPDKLYVGMNLYDPNFLETISFNITKGGPAKLDAESPWMYYNEETGYYERIYKNDDEQIVKAGVRYAYAAQLRIDGVDYETNTLAHHVDVKINGVLWNTTENPYESSTLTYTWTQSPDFAVSNEPYRQKIPRISATVYDYQNTYFYGDQIVLPSSYTVTFGIPAKFDDTTDVWQKKNGDTWEDCTENTFKGGTYRLKVKLVVDGEDNDTHYLNDGIWGAINGTTMSSRYWHSLDTPTQTANSSYVWMVSPEHIIEGPAGYTVAFDANGGTGNMASVNNVSGNYTLPPNGFTPPNGKQFKCWSVNGNEKNPFESISVTANVTVKAVWKDITTTSYTVSFNSNGGSGSMAVVTNAPSLYTLPANGFTPPANKQFKCWAVGAQNTEYDPGDKITITADVTVKAVWEAITSSRQVISDVEATSLDLDTIPTLYGLLKIPTFTVTQGAPAYINATTSNLRWQKKIEGVWTNQDSVRFTPGEWRISSSLRIDGTDGYHYEFGNPTTLTVDGQAWTVENNGKPSVHPNYSHANILSPVFTIVDDPNVQPPVPVESVHMVLNGYTPDAAAASATVTTDANVTVEVLGFLEGIDSNGDGQPDTTKPVTGNFASGKLYVVALKIKAKSGYDISGLTAQNVSLDRAIMDMFEENVIADETFSGMYMLGDAMQYTVTYDANGGTGSMADATDVSGDYVLPVCGFTAPNGKQFKAWSVGGVEKAVGSTINVTANTTVTAIWEAVEYNVIVTGGTASVGAGTPITKATMGTTVTLTAGAAPSGQMFDKWVINGATVADANSATTTFVMSAGNVTAEATYKNIPVGNHPVTIAMKDGDDITTAYTQAQFAALQALASKGLLVEDSQVNGYRNNAGKLLFTMNNTLIDLQEGLTEQDYIHYTLSPQEVAEIKAYSGEDITEIHLIFPSKDVVIATANATVTVPVAGEHPDFNPVSGDSSRYTVAFETWYLHESPYPDLDANSVFEHRKSYALRIRFSPNAGYQFDSNTVFTVNGNSTLCFGGRGDREYLATAYAETYTVTYDANGGTGSMAQEILTHDNDGFAKNYTFPQCGFTAPAGQEFDKWLWYYESNPGSTYEITPGQSPWISGNIVVKALWKIVEYNVTVTGGTASVGAGTPIIKATMGTTVTLTAGAAPSGQMFDKWVVNGVVVADANSATTTFVMPAGNVTATATYKNIPVVTYTVTFNANGGTGSMADATGVSGDYVLPVCGFTAPNGKQFKAWSVGGVEKAVGSTINVTANTTVTAVWENIPVTYYTVTFDSAGGSAVTAQTIEAGQKATKPADPTKSGYDFKGWTLNGSAYDFNSAVNGDITLVATWEQQQVVPTTYTVSFAANGGTGTMADVTGISGEYTLPANGFTAPDGKQFKAWSVGGVEKAVGDKITVTADTTVTAVWETIPAGHTCDIKPVAKVEPSCTEGGKEAYYKCEGCGKFYEDALGTKEITDLAAWGNLAKLGHTESDWKSDKDNHWKECTVAACGVIIENSKAAHADANNDGKCDTCEYNVGTTTTNPNNKPSDDVQSPQTGDNSMMWLWIALLFVSGFGVVTTTVYSKKKKICEITDN